MTDRGSSVMGEKTAASFHGSATDLRALAATWVSRPHGPHSGDAVAAGLDCVACMGADVLAALAVRPVAAQERANEWNAEMIRDARGSQERINAALALADRGAYLHPGKGFGEIAEVLRRALTGDATRPDPVSSTGHRWPCTRFYVTAGDAYPCTCDRPGDASPEPTTESAP